MVTTMARLTRPCGLWRCPRLREERTWRSSKSAAKFDDGISVSDQSSCKDPLIPL